MRNISQLVATTVLLATQAHVILPGNVAAAGDQSTLNTSVLEVRINTNTAEVVQITGPNKPDYDTAVLAPLHAAEAENARLAAAQAAAAKAAAAKAAAAKKTATVLVAAPTPGSHTDWMQAAGIAASDYGYVDYIIDHESGWGVTKSNYAGSGAYGLGQALPASKMAKFGADYMTDPVTQLRWANAYAVGSYGSWANAYNHWITRHSW